MAGVEVYTAPGMRTSDWLLSSILMCVYRTRTIFAFCFVLESCKHQAGKIERLYVCLVQQKTQQGLQGSANNTIPNIPQCTLPPRPVYKTLLSNFFEGLAPRQPHCGRLHLIIVKS